MNKRTSLNFNVWSQGLMLIFGIILMVLAIIAGINGPTKSESCILQVGEFYYSESNTEYFSISLKNVTTNCLKISEVEQWSKK